MEFYDKNGYLVTKDLIVKSQIQTIQDEILENTQDTRSNGYFHRGSNYSNTLKQKINVWKSNGVLQNFISSNKFKKIASELLKTNELRIFQDQVLIKKSNGHSKPSPWHQDSPYFPMNGNKNVVTAWIPLTKVTKQSGSMRYLKESHKLGEIRQINMFNPDQPLQDKNLEVVDIELDVGDVVWHHGLTLHYAHANQTDEDRIAYAIVFFEDGIEYNGRRSPSVPKNYTSGGKLDGKDFIKI